MTIKTFTFIQTVSQAAAIIDARPFKTQNLYVHALNGLNLRATPDIKSDNKRQLLPYGTKLSVTKILPQIQTQPTIDGIKGFWVKVKSKRSEGFVYSAFLSRFPTCPVRNVKLGKQHFTIACFFKRVA